MSDIKNNIWNNISELTGRDFGELSGDMTLQNDLGFDSLKIMSLWKACFALLPEGVEGNMSEAAKILTLDELCDFINKLSTTEAPNTLSKKYTSRVRPVGRNFTPSLSQQFFLVSHYLCESTSLCSSVEFEGDLDIDRLQKAWQKLVNRHTSLRTQYYIPADATNLNEIEYILRDNTVVPNINEIDLSNLPNNDEAWENYFVEQHNRTWDIREWPLHEISVVRIAEKRSMVVLSNEHVISDGLGNQRMISELIALYDDLESSVENLRSDEEFENLVKLANAYHDQNELDEYSELEKRISDVKCLWDPNQNLGKLPKSNFRNLKFEISPEVTKSLEEIAHEYNLSIYALLLASLNKAISERVKNGNSKAQNLIQIPTAGTVYPHADLGNLLGCFALNLSLVTKISKDDKDILSQASAIQESLSEALFSGYDRSQARLLGQAMSADFPLANGMIPNFLLDQAKQSLRGNIYAPFTGKFSLPEKTNGLKICNYRAATKNVAGTIDLLHEICNGKLSIFVNYDANCFEFDQIQGFVKAHLETLNKLVDSAHQGDSLNDLIENDLKRIACDIINVECETLTLETDLHRDLGVDSLQKIRLINEIVSKKGCRKVAKKLVSCRNLGEMLSFIQTAAQNQDKTINSPISIEPPTTSIVKLDRNLPDIPFRHIEAQINRTPHLEAVSDQYNSITYEELGQKANNVANQLIKTGVRPGDHVAMLCSRSTDMLVAILAILKTGAAYVPLDVHFPTDRISYIISHAECTHAIVHADYFEEKFLNAEIPSGLEHVIGLDRKPDISTGLTVVSTEDFDTTIQAPFVDVCSTDTMVLLYTSGSTGHPKGVALNHLGYMNRFAWHHDQFQLKVGERVACKTSCSFDVSLWELFWPLMVGGVVCAVEKEIVVNPWELKEWLIENQIAVMHFVPSLFTEFVDALCHEPLNLRNLRWLIFSGEALPVFPVRKWMETQGACAKLANLYGPTEASIDVTSYVINEIPTINQTRIPIGAPIENVTMLILDSESNLIKDIGVQGELCIAGIQLAQGYYKDEEKTQKAFIQNHLKEKGIPGDRIYRTGDFASWDENGFLDYHGRMDTQIKLRGFRVELGEIEAVVSAHPEVSEAAVIHVKQENNGSDYLELYFAPNKVSEADLKIWAAQYLAEYAVPTKYFAMETLPKNHNGKLDRNELKKLNAVEKTNHNVATFTAEKTRPIAYNQRAMLRETPITDIGASISAFDYYGSLNLEKFIAAINKVISEHSSLRSTFVEEDGQWLQKISSKSISLTPKYLDGTGLSEENFNESFENSIRFEALSIHPSQWPLMKILIAKRPDGYLRFGFAGHALIGDMISANTFYTELWSHYFLEGKASTRVAKDSHDNFVAINDHLELYEKDVLEFWENHLEAKKLTKGLTKSNTKYSNSFAEQKTETVSISSEDNIVLQEVSRGLPNIQLYHLISAAIYQEVAYHQNCDSVVINHRVNGRNATNPHAYWESLDCFAYNFPIALTNLKSKSLIDTALDFEELFTNAPLKGASYDAVGSRLRSDQWPANVVSEIRINYLGDGFNSKNQTIKPVKFSNGSRVAPPESQRTCAIEFWISIHEGNIDITAGYSSGHYYPIHIAEFLNKIVSEITNFITRYKNERKENAA